MICTDLNQLLGIQCMPLDAQGTMALIETPFTFADGAAVRVFAEDTGTLVHFFDDGFTVWHLMGRGLKFEDGRHLRFLQNIAARHGIDFSNEWELKASGHREDASHVFARFVAALLEVSVWEREQEQVDTVTTQLIEEVATALMKWRPSSHLQRSVSLTGVSRQTYEVNFVQGNEVVLVVTPHHASVASAVRKLLDLRNQPANESLTYRVVLEDRQDLKSAQREGLVLSTIAHVTMMASLLRDVAALRMH